MENAIIHWSALEYDHKDKSIDWFWAVGLSAIAGAVIAILYHNYFFGVFLILAGICMGMFGARKPENVDIGIFENGITVGNRKYLWQDINGFNILSSGASQHLIIHTERPMSPIISIPAHFQNQEELHDIVSQYVEYNENLHDSGLQKLMDRIGY